MKKAAAQKIVIIGCGNVAWHVANRLHEYKDSSLYVYNHLPNKNLADFKKQLGCKTFTSLDHVIGDADVYLLCVADRSVADTAARLEIKNPRALLLHTSGSLPLKELGRRAHGCGVLYPLQTFTRQDQLDWSQVPLLVEAKDKDLPQLTAFAKRFSSKVIPMHQQDRLRYHLAAVLVNNFTNALYTAASDLVPAKPVKGIDLLLPLIRQGVAKLERLEPRAAQTGPAKRKDKVVQKKHLTLLEKDPDLKKIYKQLSRLIVKQQD